MSPVAVGFALGLLLQLVLAKPVSAWVALVGMLSLAVCASEIVSRIAKESA